MTPKDLPEITTDDKEFLTYNPNTSDVIEWIQKYAAAAYELGARSTAAQPADRAITSDELKLITDLRWALGDNGKRMQPELVEYAREIKALADAAAQPAGWKLVPVEATDEMVSAYLQANDAYWRRADELPKKIGKWRMGSPSEATADGYRAMLAAAPPAASGDSTPPSASVQGDSTERSGYRPEAAVQGSLWRKKPVVVTASRWFKNGDHPLDYSRDHDGLEGGELRIFTGVERKANGWEGDIVRYYRRPDVSGDSLCEQCGKTHHVHGWIDTLEQGHRVCPGDWIITGVKGERYPCKPDIFAATYESADNGQPNLLLEWAVAQWRDEVEHRPMVNKHRRTLDGTWRQVIRFAGGDPDALVGPSHDSLLAQQPAPPPAASQQADREAE